MRRPPVGEVPEQGDAVTRVDTDVGEHVTVQRLGSAERQVSPGGLSRVVRATLAATSVDT